MPEVAVATHHRHGRFTVEEKFAEDRMNRIAVVQFNGITPPQWLQGEALIEWNRITDILRNANMLTAVDANLLAMYCDTFARWLEIRQQIETEGPTIANATNPNTFKMNPLIRVQQSLARDLLALSKHFGFSPLSRQNIRVPKDKPPEEIKPENSLTEF